MGNPYTVSIISDTHGEISNYIRPYLKKSNCIIHAGDICDTKIIKDLETYCDDVICIAGNNDIPARFQDSVDKKIISKLNTVEKTNIKGKSIVIEHGDRFGHHPQHQKLREEYADADIIVYGHTHIQVCDQEQTPWVINPGACGHTRNNDGGPCFMQIEIKDQVWYIIPYCFN